MRIALAQINSVLGDVSANRLKILEFINQAHSRKCDLVVFPEGAFLGYPPNDLLERSDLIKKQNQEIQKLQRQIPKGLGVLVGCFEGNKARRGRPFFNSAVFLEKGKKPQFFRKQLLATGDVFDEGRFLEPGKTSDNVLKFMGKKFLVTICEDIWGWPDKNGRSIHSENPLEKIKRPGFDFVLNLSSSPYYVGKEKERQYFAGATAKHFKCPIVYVNAVGAQDEIVFDGSSFVLDKKGQALLKCQSFSEDINVIDADTLEVWNPSTKIKEIEGLRRALVLGIKDFCAKIGIRKVHLGSSGGIDSALVAALATDALGPANVTQIAMPGPHSAGMSEELAQQLATNLGNAFIRVPITALFEAVEKSLKKPFELAEFNLVHENIQARLRGLTLMAYSNHTGSMLLNTSNKSEFSTGYSTLYGDMCGGLSPLGDLTKSQVYELAKYYNIQGEVIPEKIISRPPSAELRPDQKDSDSLPEYPILDKAVQKIVEKQMNAKSPTEKWLVDVLMKSEFKRWQAPPILKMSSHAFGRGRRYPIAHKSRA